MTARDFLTWYAKNKRDLPWRKTRDPYWIWISEVMLQQTQVARVVDFYGKFVEKFPTIESLSHARWSQLLSVVNGMGYYRRFRNVLAAAKVLVRDYDGEFPQEYAELRKLPGVGDYTANAILAFAFGKQVPVVDTNVRQMLVKFFGGKMREMGKMADEKSMKELAMEVCPRGKARDFFQALMDYANSVLFVRAHEQKRVPTEAKQDGKNQKRQKSARADLSRKVHEKFMNSERAEGKQGRAASVIRATAGIIIHRGKILIQKRPAGKPHAGFWEFPGGKIEDGEDERACLKREIHEEFGIQTAVRPPFYRITYAKSGRTVRVTFHRCSILLGKPKSREGQEFLWVEPHQFPDFKFLPGDREAVRRLGLRRHSLLLGRVSHL